MLAFYKPRQVGSLALFNIWLIFVYIVIMWCTSAIEVMISTVRLSSTIHIAWELLNYYLERIAWEYYSITQVKATTTAMKALLNHWCHVNITQLESIPLHLDLLPSIAWSLLNHRRENIAGALLGRVTTDYKVKASREHLSTGMKPSNSNSGKLQMFIFIQRSDTKVAQIPLVSKSLNKKRLALDVIVIVQ